MLLLKRLKLYRDRKSLLLLGLVFIAVLSVGVFLALNPPTYTVTETVEEQVYETTSTHYSDVAQSSMLFKQGERTVEPDRYFIFNHPEVVIEFEPKLNGDTLQPKEYDETYSTTVVAQSARGEETFVTKEINSDSDMIAYSNGSVTVDMREFEQYRSELNEELPRNSQTVLEIGHVTNITDSQAALNDTAKIVFADSRTYKVTVEEDMIENRETKSVERPQPSQTVKIDGSYYHITGLLVIVVSGIILIVLLYLIYNRYFCGKTIEESQYEYDLEKYNSWITTGQPYQEPTLRDPGDLIQVDSLKGLVDIAIDNNTRVVHSRGLGRFYVYDEHAIYAYSAPGVNANGFYIGPNENVPKMNPDIEPFEGTSKDSFGFSETPNDNNDEELDESE